MKASVIVFPGSNCDRDAAVALERLTGRKASMVWHDNTSLPDSDLIVLPGGFSYGDYLRSGAMAARSPIMRAVAAEAAKGAAILGICNGFQALTECGLLPGVLMRNAGLKFICKDVHVRLEVGGTPFSSQPGDVLKLPIAHKDGNYFASPEMLDRLESEGQIAFRYCDADGAVTATANPNGSQRNIAGVTDKSGRILGMMPHPERAVDPILGSTDGSRLFEAALATLH